MATVIDFSANAMATLRARVAAVEEDNRDLLAFAQGHFGAAHAVQLAALDLIDTETIDDLVGVVTRAWPATLGLDAIGLAVRGPCGALHAHCGGYRIVEPRLVDRVSGGLPPITVRDVTRGHPLFGAAAEEIRAEALIRIEGPGVLGTLALGQCAPQGLAGEAGAQILHFLAQVIARMVARCRPSPPPRS